MPEPVIACTLDADGQAAQVNAFADLCQRALLETEEISGGLRLHFSAQPGTCEELEQLIEAESECCLFLDFRLHAHEGKLVLEVTGPERARPLIRELFEAETATAFGQ